VRIEAFWDGPSGGRRLGAVMSDDALESQSLTTLLEQGLRLARGEPVLQADDYWARVHALRRRGGRDTFDAATRLCDSSDAISRAFGADILAQLGYDSAGASPFADEAEPVLVRLLADVSTAVVISTLSALGHLRRGSTMDMERFKTHPAPDVREALASALGMRDDAIEALIELSADEDAGTRDWATFGLGSQSDVDTQEVRETLAARLTDEDPDVRGEAVIGLARRKDERAIEVIARELKDGYSLAVDAAEEMPRRRFVSELERLARELPEDPFVARALAACRSATE
jgi:HEAT repeats